MQALSTKWAVSKKLSKSSTPWPAGKSRGGRLKSAAPAAYWFSPQGPWPAVLLPGYGGGVSGSSLKNGVFLTVPGGRNPANAAKTPHAAACSRLRSSDRPLGTAKFWSPGTVRNIRRFFLWIGQHPHPARKKDGWQLKLRTAGRTPPTLMRLSWQNHKNVKTRVYFSSSSHMLL